MKVLKVFAWIGTGLMLLFIAAVECVCLLAIVDDKIREEMRQATGY